MFDAMQMTFLSLARRNGLLISILAIAIAGFLLRVLPLYDTVVQEDQIRFQGIDAYYHVRLTHYTTGHFPSRMEHDPLRRHPNGQRVDVYPAYDVVNAAVALIAGGGSPSPRTIDLTLAFLPPILGLFTILFAGLGGRVIGGPPGGIAAALVAAFMPGGPLLLTRLGEADHHALELFLLSAAWYLLLRIHSGDAGERPSYGLWGALGVIIGGYTLTWEGSPILPAVIGTVVGIRTITTREDSANLLLRVRQLLVMCGTTMLVLILGVFASAMVFVSGLLVITTALLPSLLLLIRRVFRRLSDNASLILWALVVAGLLALAYAALPHRYADTLVTNMGRFLPSPAALTVSEMNPLTAKHPGEIAGLVGLYPLWGAVGLLMCLLRGRSMGNIGVAIIVVNAFFIPAAILQLRFLPAAGLGIALSVAALFPANQHAPWTRRTMLLFLAWVVTGPLLSSPSTLGHASVDNGPAPEILESVDWFNEQRTMPDSTGTDFGGVLNWWDSGYYLTTLAGRPPLSNPTQSGARDAARLLLDTAHFDIAARLRRDGIKHILIESNLATITTDTASTVGRFPAIVTWAGRRIDEFYRTVYFEEPGGGLSPRIAYSPEYFRSLYNRLLYHGTEEISPSSQHLWVIRTELHRTTDGSVIDVVRSGQRFASYDFAQQFLQQNVGAGWRLVSFSPYDTCIPLEPVPGISKVFSSKTAAFYAPGRSEPLPAAQIFEVR